MIKEQKWLCPIESRCRTRHITARPRQDRSSGSGDNSRTWNRSVCALHEMAHSTGHSHDRPAACITRSNADMPGGNLTSPNSQWPLTGRNSEKPQFQKGERTVLRKAAVNFKEDPAMSSECYGGRQGIRHDRKWKTAPPLETSVKRILHPQFPKKRRNNTKLFSPHFNKYNRRNEQYPMHGPLIRVG